MSACFASCVGALVACLVLQASSALAERAPAAGVAAADDPLAPARKECRKGEPCRHYGLLVRWAHDPQHGPEAVKLLGELGQIQGCSTVASAAARGVDDALRIAAFKSLVQLARIGAARKRIESLAREDADPEVQAVARRALERTSDAAATDAEAEGEERTASDPGRVIYGQTAFSRPAGTITWSVYNIAYHTLDYAPTDYLEIGIGAVVPVFIYGFFPRVKLSTEIADHVRLGVVVTAGVAGTYVDINEGAGIYGAGPVLSVGSRSLLFNVSVSAGGATTFSNDEFAGGETVWAILANAGFSAEVSRKIRLNVEVYAPFADYDYNGKIWAVLYGIRIFGKHLFGDVSFAIPVYPGVGNDILRYAPIGLPLLTFGYQG